MRGEQESRNIVQTAIVTISVMRSYLTTRWALVFSENIE